MKKTAVLVYGGGGQIGSRVVEMLSAKFKISAPSHKEADVTNYPQVKKNIGSVKPAQILYCVGFTNIDEGIKKAKEAFLLNAGAVGSITHLAKKLDIPFYYLSTEVVFDGQKTSGPYKVDDQPNPLSLVAATKRAGELLALDASPKNSVLRLIVCYSAYYPKKLDLVRLALDKVKKGETFTATDDQEINPIYIDHAVKAIEAILANQASGIYHIGSTDYTTPYKFTKKVAQALGFDKSRIHPISFKEFAKTRPEPRPKYQWLDIKKFQKDFGKGILRSIDEGIAQFKKDYLAHQQA